MASQFRKAKREKEFDLFVSGRYADIDDGPKPSEQIMAAARKLKWTKGTLRPKVPFSYHHHRRKRLQRAPTSLTFRPKQDPDHFRGPDDDEIEPLIEEEEEKQLPEKLSLSLNSISFGQPDHNYSSNKPPVRNGKDELSYGEQDHLITGEGRKYNSGSGGRSVKNRARH